MGRDPGPRSWSPAPSEDVDRAAFCRPAPHLFGHRVSAPWLKAEMSEGGRPAERLRTVPPRVVLTWPLAPLYGASRASRPCGFGARRLIHQRLNLTSKHLER